MQDLAIFYIHFLLSVRVPQFVPTEEGIQLYACPFINLPVPVQSFMFRKYFIQILDSNSPEDLIY
jgi:hypothetical protein